MTDPEPTAPLAIAGAVASVTVLAFIAVLAGGDTFASDGHLERFVPAQLHLAGAISAGALPEWWDGVGLGVPFAANPAHAVLYPPGWLAALRPEVWLLDWLLVAHLLFAGLGVAALARRLGADALGAAVAGAAFATCGAGAAAILAGGGLHALAWTSWVAWAADRVARAAGPRRLAAAGLALAALAGAQILAGGVTPAAASLLGAAVLVAARARRRALALAVIAGAGAVAALCALPAIVAAQVGPATPAPMPPGRLLEWLWPLSLGDAAEQVRGAYLGLPIAALAALAAARDRAGRAALLAAAPLCAAALWLSELFAFGAVALVVAAAGLGLSRALARRSGWRRWAGPPAAAVILAPMVVLCWQLPRVERAAAARVPPLLAKVAGGDEPARLYRPMTLPGDDRGEPAARVRARLATAAPNSAATHGLAHVRGHDAGQSRHVEAAWRAGAVAGGRFLDLYAVRYAVVPATVAVPAGMPVVGADPARGAVVLVENEHRRPRAFVAPRWRRLADDDAVAAALFGLGGALRLATVHLSGEADDGMVQGSSEGPVPAPACERRAPRPERVTLRCESRTGGYAVLLDAWAPGWRATVDGAPAAIERADLLARAVRIEPGARAIVFRYRTPGLRLSGAVAALAWLNLAVAALLLRRRRRR